MRVKIYHIKTCHCIEIHNLKSVFFTLVSKKNIQISLNVVNSFRRRTPLEVRDSWSQKKKVKEYGLQTRIVSSVTILYCSCLSHSEAELNEAQDSAVFDDRREMVAVDKMADTWRLLLDETVFRILGNDASRCEDLYIFC